MALSGTGTPQNPAGGELPMARLQAWLAANVPGTAPAASARLVTGGRSNLTYVISCADGTRIVLRRPPAGRWDAGAHDVLREHRILNALHQTSVPVPAPLGACDDEVVIGAPFYVMEHVEGEVLDSELQAGTYLPWQRWQLGMELIEVMARLHALSPGEHGLGDLSPPGVYAERHLRRWSRQWDAQATRDLPAVREAVRRLQAAAPGAAERALVHHDYRLGNVITGGGDIRAVLDWELAALGDPAADLGYLGVRMAVPAAALGPPGEPLRLSGFPSFDQMVERYEHVTGRPVRGLGFHRALAALRWTVIAEGIYLRFRQGVMGSQEADLGFLRDRVEILAEFTLHCASSRL
jgi:aminoglycoside phosphotransferase (APT) family kinase protein